MSDIELKPCPFCGGAAKKFHWPGHYGCADESCGGYAANLTPEQWNRRVSERGETESVLGVVETQRLCEEIKLVTLERNVAIKERDAARATNAELTRELSELRADRERMDWMEENPFMAYRDRDPGDGKLCDHFTLVDEDAGRKNGRTGIVKSTLRAAIDAARAKDGKDNTR